MSAGSLRGSQLRENGSSLGPSRLWREIRLVSFGGYALRKSTRRKPRHPINFPTLSRAPRTSSFAPIFVRRSSNRAEVPRPMPALTIAASRCGRNFFSRCSPCLQRPRAPRRSITRRAERGEWMVCPPTRATLSARYTDINAARSGRFRHPHSLVGGHHSLPPRFVIPSIRGR